MYLVPKEPLFEAESDANQEKKNEESTFFFIHLKGFFGIV
jgi:hypothetical protein